MQLEWLKKLGQSIRHIAIALAVILGVPAFLYWLWSPGGNRPLRHYEHNAIWIGHGWLGDDGWFQRNARNRADFRDETKIAALLEKLRANQIATVYPHLCPAQYDGKIALYSDEQMERFLDVAESCQMRVIPWIGGVFEESARPAEAAWRQAFTESVRELLSKHPRLAGVQVNIEPMPDGNADFLALLRELRPVLGNKILSVAGYPPPTLWQRSTNVHWSLEYITEIAKNCDQMAVMMYDTAIPLEKFYIHLMRSWTQELAQCVPATCELILGIPAYDDADVGYHRPEVENLTAALSGIANAELQRPISGIAIYCEWEMTPAKWQEYRRFPRFKE